MIFFRNVSTHAQIKNIIFDLGGVILPIKTQLSVDAFAKLGITNNDPLQTLVFRQYEKGIISTPEFLKQMHAFSDREITDKQIIDAWNALILDYVPEKLRLVKAASQNYKTCLLSNTNELHYLDFMAKLKQQTNYEDLSDVLHKPYYSHLMHMRKPDAEIFIELMRLENLKPEETVYFEDTAEHVNTAKSLGIQAILITPEQGIEHYMSLQKHE